MISRQDYEHEVVIKKKDTMVARQHQEQIIVLNWAGVFCCL